MRTQLVIRFLRAARSALPLIGILGLAACASRTATVSSGDPAPASDVEEALFLYVANQEAAAVTVVDVASGEVAEVIDLEALGFGANAKPHHIAVEPDGSAWYVSLIAANRVVKFDRDNQMVGSVDFERPGLLALHPTENWLFVGRSMAAVNPPQRIGRIDRTSLEVEEFDVFIPRPHALVVSPDGRFVYSASLAENSIAVVDAESGEAELVRLDAPSPHTLVQFAISPDGRTLVATGQLTGRLLVFDLAPDGTPTLAREIDVEAQPWHPSFTPDGSSVWFGNLMANAVTVVSTADWTVEEVLRGEGIAQPHGSAISPDGARVFIASRNEGGEYTAQRDFGYDRPDGTVAVFDAASRDLLRVIETPPYAAGLGIAGSR